MSQRNNIDVTITPVGDVDDIEYIGMNYVSFVSSPGGNSGGTYGIPALLSEQRIKDEGLPVKILYVNPANIVSMLATRNS